MSPCSSFQTLAALPPCPTLCCWIKTELQPFLCGAPAWALGWGSSRLLWSRDKRICMTEVSSPCHCPSATKVCCRLFRGRTNKSQSGSPAQVQPKAACKDASHIYYILRPVEFRLLITFSQCKINKVIVNWAVSTVKIHIWAHRNVVGCLNQAKSVL